VTGGFEQYAPGVRLRRTRGATLLLAGVLVVAACGDGGDDEARGDDATTTGAPATGALDASRGRATCTDEGADTSVFAPGADLVGVDLTATGDGLTVAWRLASDAATAGTTLWSVFARPPGGANVQLGARLEGTTRSPFVFMFGDGIQQDVPPENMTVEGSTVRVSYPQTALGSLAPPFDWRAESTVEVEDVDYCPGGADATVLDDERLPFDA
jgi:hypothetical protein